MSGSSLGHEYLNDPVDKECRYLGRYFCTVQRDGSFRRLKFLRVFLPTQFLLTIPSMHLFPRQLVDPVFPFHLISNFICLYLVPSLLVIQLHLLLKVYIFVVTFILSNVLGEIAAPSFILRRLRTRQNENKARVIRIIGTTIATTRPMVSFFASVKLADVL